MIARELCTRLLVGLVGIAVTATGMVAALALPTAQAAGDSVSRLADPDTVAANGRYVTYATSVGGTGSGECRNTGKQVPYVEHGSGENLGTPKCIAGDAMPSGVGSWAEGPVWAPGVVRFGQNWYMYYTATKRGTGQKCIGRAIADRATGPFRNQGEWACPPGGRWAIDADPFVAGGRMYVAYRDDYAASTGNNGETALSVVRVNANGWAEWNTRRTLLLSTDITWESRDKTPGPNVIENPSLFRAGNGQWYVIYSGNNWRSNRYSSGIARCGTSPLPAKRCTPIKDGRARPYFGYRGPGGINPFRTLPGNHAGPGGMSVFQTPSGDHKVVWHWWTGEHRRIKVADLRGNNDDFTVG